MGEKSNQPVVETMKFNSNKNASPWKKLKNLIFTQDEENAFEGSLWIDKPTDNERL